MIYYKNIFSKYCILKENMYYVCFYLNFKNVLHSHLLSRIFAYLIAVENIICIKYLRIIWQKHIKFY